MPAIRLLSPADVPALAGLSNSASWNQTAGDWARLLALAPQGCFGIELDGTLIASTTVLCYPEHLAWLGMVLTAPDHRGHGFARKLVEHAIDYAGARTIRLDASDMGRRLYQSLGFIDECAVERWRREPFPLPPLATDATAPFLYDCQLDRECFEADRSSLIGKLAQLDAASVPDAAFALGRPGAAAAYFGPCVSTTAAAARDLLEWFLIRHPGELVVWDLFPHHENAAAIASQFGFRPVRRLTRMSLHAPRAAQPDTRIYAIAGFEYG